MAQETGIFMAIISLAFSIVFLLGVFYFTRSFWQWYFSYTEIKNSLDDIKSKSITNDGISAKLDKLFIKLTVNERLQEQYVR